MTQPRERPWSHPTDVLRDVGALAALILTLVLDWTHDRSGAAVIYVLLAVMCSMAALVLPYLQGLLVRADGRPVQWPTGVLRIWLTVPLAGALVAAAAIDITSYVKDFDAAGRLVLFGIPSEDALQYGVFMAAVAVGLAMVPRIHELRASQRGMAGTSTWRFTAGCLATLGLVLMVASSIMALVHEHDRGLEGASFAFVTLATAGGFAALLVMFGVPALRVAAGRSGMQPAALWIMVAFIAQALFRDPHAVSESASAPLYGLWIVVLAASLCAVPLAAARDGAPGDARFWQAVALHALYVVIAGAVVGALVALTSIIQLNVIGDAGAPSAAVIWWMVSTIGTAVVAGAAVSQLRADLVRGRGIVLGGAALLVVIAILQMALGDGLGFDLATEFLGAIAVVVVALTFPRSVREQVAARPADAPPVAALYGQPVQYGQPAFEQPHYAQPQYGQPQYGQPQYGQPQYGQAQYGNPPPAQPPYGGPSHMAPPLAGPGVEETVINRRSGGGTTGR